MKEKKATKALKYHINDSYKCRYYQSSAVMESGIAE